MTGAINDAVERDVPVMTFDSDAPASKRFSYYGVDDSRLGEQVMSELGKLMNGKGKIAIFAGNQNAPNLQHRVKGSATRPPNSAASKSSAPSITRRRRRMRPPRSSREQRVPGIKDGR